MKYLLDTDHISILQSGSEPGCSRLKARMRTGRDEDFVWCVISFHEQVIGFHAYLNKTRSLRDLVKGYDRLRLLLMEYTKTAVLEFDDHAASKYHELRSRRLRVDTMDLRIASIALSRSLILLTRNTRDFGRIPNLMIEDWTI